MAQVRVGGQDSLRRFNLSRLLRHVHGSASVSRSDLATLTGLNRSTVGALVADLNERGLVEEVKPPASGQRAPGRPSPLVRPHSSGVTVLACDIAVDTLSCAIIGLGGRLYAAETVARPREETSAAETVAELCRLAGIVRRRVKGGRMVAVGVGVAGAVAGPDGVVRVAPNLAWEGVPLSRLILESLEMNVPVRVGNEANLGALAEHARGAGAGVDHMIYVSSEVGLGAGIIVEGRLLEGADGFAGEAGHMPVNPEGRRCGCGGIGCWETEVGERALLRAASMPVDGGLDALDELFARADDADQQVLDALVHVGTWLGVGLVGLVNIFNPRVIVLGGVLARAFPLISTTVEDVVESRCPLPAGGLVRLVPSALQGHAVLFGAAEIALTNLLFDPTSASPVDPGEQLPLPQPVAVAHVRTPLGEPGSSDTDRFDRTANQLETI